MTWPWVSSAPVSGTMSAEVGGDRRAVERGVRVQRGGTHRLPALHRRADLVLPLLRGGEPGGRDLVGERGEGALGVADDAGGAEALGVVAVDVDRRELHVRVLEQRLRRGREVGQPRPDGEHEVGLADQVVVDRGALQTDPADLPPRPLLHRALAGHGLQHGNAGRAGEGLQLRGGVGVDDAATGDDDRLAARAASSRATACDLVGVGDRAADHPVALGEELGREVERVALDVLGQRQHHGAGVHRVGQHAHRVRQRGEQLLGPVDAVEEPRDRPERVVDRGVGLDRVLQLLQHRALPAGGVGVAGQQQHGQPVHRRQPGRGDQVQRTRTDRGGDREGGAPAVRLRVADRQVGQRLLVAALHERHQVAELVQRLAHPGHVAVAEDAQSGGDQPAALAVGDGVLPGQVGDHGLGDGQAGPSCPNGCCS